MHLNGPLGALEREYTGRAEDKEDIEEHRFNIQPNLSEWDCLNQISTNGDNCREDQVVKLLTAFPERRMRNKTSFFHIVLLPIFWPPLETADPNSTVSTLPAHGEDTPCNPLSTSPAHTGRRIR
ncbi:hypothetical protein CRPA11_14550 [Pseudomonas aeruginosa]